MIVSSTARYDNVFAPEQVLGTEKIEHSQPVVHCCNLLHCVENTSLATHCNEARCHFTGSLFGSAHVRNGLSEHLWRGGRWHTNKTLSHVFFCMRV